jgi:large subunit ribosomal protein L9
VRRDAKRAESVKMKDRIERLTIEIAARAGEAGKLFGSVTNIDIERALGAQGVSIDRRRILLAEPIKELGEFVVPVRIDAEVEASLKLKVAAE